MASLKNLTALDLTQTKLSDAEVAQFARGFAPSDDHQAAASERVLNVDLLICHLVVSVHLVAQHAILNATIHISLSLFGWSHRVVDMRWLLAFHKWFESPMFRFTIRDVLWLTEPA